MTVPAQRWIWRARYVSAYDGDTVTLYIDRGINEFAIIPIRLLACYCKELGEGGEPARDFTRNWLAEARMSKNEYPLIVQTYKPDPREKYGRWLGKIWSKETGACLNDDLVSAGLATVTP